jgi:hypothetical protein
MRSVGNSPDAYHDAVTVISLREGIQKSMSLSHLGLANFSSIVTQACRTTVTAQPWSHNISQDFRQDYTTTLRQRGLALCQTRLHADGSRSFDRSDKRGSNMSDHFCNLFREHTANPLVN